MSSVFQPVVRITYAERGEHEYAQVNTYDLFNKMHTSPPKELKTADIPVLLFQLVDKGYALRLDGDWHSGAAFAATGLHSKSILAFSPEWIARAQADAEGKVK